MTLAKREDLPEELQAQLSKSGGGQTNKTKMFILQCLEELGEATYDDMLIYIWNQIGEVYPRHRVQLNTGKLISKGKVKRVHFGTYALAAPRPGRPPKLESPPEQEIERAKPAVDTSKAYCGECGDQIDQEGKISKMVHDHRQFCSVVCLQKYKKSMG